MFAKNKLGFAARLFVGFVLGFAFVTGVSASGLDVSQAASMADHKYVSANSINFPPYTRDNYCVITATGGLVFNGEFVAPGLKFKDYCAVGYYNGLNVGACALLDDGSGFGCSNGYVKTGSYVYIGSSDNATIWLIDSSGSAWSYNYYADSGMLQVVGNTNPISSTVSRVVGGAWDNWGGASNGCVTYTNGSVRCQNGSDYWGRSAYGGTDIVDAVHTSGASDFGTNNGGYINYQAILHLDGTIESNVPGGFTDGPYRSVADMRIDSPSVDALCATRASGIVDCKNYGMAWITTYAPTYPVRSVTCNQNSCYAIRVSDRALVRWNSSGLSQVSSIVVGGGSSGGSGSTVYASGGLVPVHVMVPVVTGSGSIDTTPDSVSGNCWYLGLSGAPSFSCQSTGSLVFDVDGSNMDVSYLGRFTGWATSNDGPEALKYWAFGRSSFSLTDSPDSKVPVFLNEPQLDLGGESGVSALFTVDIRHPVDGLVERVPGAYEHYSLEDGPALAGFYDWVSFSGSAAPQTTWKVKGVSYDGTEFESGRLNMKAKFRAAKPFAYARIYVYGPVDSILRPEILLGETRPIIEMVDQIQWVPEDGVTLSGSTQSGSCAFGDCSFGNGGDDYIPAPLRWIRDRIGGELLKLGIVEKFWNFVDWHVPLTPDLSIRLPKISIDGLKPAVAEQTVELVPIPQFSSGVLTYGSGGEVRQLRMLGLSDNLSTKGFRYSAAFFGFFAFLLWGTFAVMCYGILVGPLYWATKFVAETFSRLTGEVKVASSQTRTFWHVPILWAAIVTMVVTFNAFFVLWSSSVLLFVMAVKPFILSILTFLTLSFGGYLLFAGLINAMITALVAWLAFYAVRYILETYGHLS